MKIQAKALLENGIRLGAVAMEHISKEEVHLSLPKEVHSSSTTRSS